MEPTRREEARVTWSLRNQLQFVMQDLDAKLLADHQARVIWDFLDRLDLSALYASIQAVGGGACQPASSIWGSLIRRRVCELFKGRGFGDGD